jgi:hypothetical protein
VPLPTNLTKFPRVSHANIFSLPPIWFSYPHKRSIPDNLKIATIAGLEYLSTDNESSVITSDISYVAEGTLTVVNGDMITLALKVRSSLKDFLYDTQKIGRKFLFYESPLWGSPSVYMSFLSRCATFRVVCGIAGEVCHWSDLLLMVQSNVRFSSPRASFQVSIGWEGIPSGVLICVKKMLAKNNRSHVLQVDTKLDMAETSGKATRLRLRYQCGGMHELVECMS